MRSRYYHCDIGTRCYHCDIGSRCYHCDIGSRCYHRNMGSQTYHWDTFQTVLAWPTSLTALLAWKKPMPTPLLLAPLVLRDTLWKMDFNLELVLSVSVRITPFGIICTWRNALLMYLLLYFPAVSDLQCGAGTLSDRDWICAAGSCTGNTVLTADSQCGRKTRFYHGHLMSTSSLF